MMMMFNDMTVVFICCGGYKIHCLGTYILRNALPHKSALSVKMWAGQAIALSEKFCSTKSFMLRKIKPKS